MGLAAVVVELNDLVWQMFEIACPQIVAHGRAAAVRVHVQRPASRRGIVEMDSAKIDAVAFNSGVVGHRS